MKIKKISFYSVSDKKDGAMCKCCGAWVKNVCVVDTVEEGRITLGTTCYEKQIKTRLNDMQKKKFNSLVKSVKNLQDRVKEWKNMTEDMYDSYGYTSWRNYDGVNSFEDLRQFREDCFRETLDDAISRLAKYNISI